MSYEGPHPIPVKSGGSGSASLTGVLSGNGTTPFTASAVTQFNVLVGGASNAITSIAPSATSGVALISQGAASNPAFGTVVVAGGGTGATSLTAHSVLIGAGTSAIVQVGPVASTGCLLASNGVGSDPGFTTATYPLTTTINQILYSSAANTVTGLTTANNGLLVTSNTGVPSILAGPGTTGNILQSNAAAAPSFSTATYPSTATGTGTILRADGTNWVATTATYPATTSVSEILYSSSANVIAGLTTANNSVVLTSATGVPSLGTSLINDFTYTSSTAGATRTLTVTNTDNTNAASTALIQTTTGGSSSGDPFHTFTVTGATSWSLGIDNSSSDAFVVAASTALGTTNIMSASTAGEINYPLQPAFLAYNSAQDDDVTGDGTAYTIICDTEVFDQNSDYNNGTGVFTAPVTGRYFLQGHVFILGYGAAHTNGNWNIVTSNRTYNASYLNPVAVGVGGNSCAFGGSTLSDMDAADTASFTITVTGGTKTVDVLGEAGATTRFDGYLAC